MLSLKGKKHGSENIELYRDDYLNILAPVEPN